MLFLLCYLDGYIATNIHFFAFLFLAFVSSSSSQLAQGDFGSDCPVMGRTIRHRTPLVEELRYRGRGVRYHTSAHLARTFSFLRDSLIIRLILLDRSFHSSINHSFCCADARTLLNYLTPFHHHSILITV